MWIISIILSYVSLTFINLWIKNLEIWSITNFFKLLTPILLVHYGCWYSYSTAPSFLNCWMLAVSVATISSVLISFFILNEIITIKTIICIIIILYSNFILMNDLSKQKNDNFPKKIITQNKT